MFATTRQFLDYFDLRSLEELPSLSEIRDLDKINEELALSDQPMATGPQSNDETAPDTGGLPAAVERLFDPLDNEPEIDESTLMSMDKVDAVNAGFETEFRRKTAATDASDDDGMAAEPPAGDSDSKDESSRHE